VSRSGHENRKTQSGTRLRSDYSYALASMRSGTIEASTSAGPATERLEGLAAILPEVFGTVAALRLERLWERIGGEPGRHSFQEIVIASREHVHVIEPLAKRPGVALVMVTSQSSSLGLVLSTVHAKLAEFEGE
jgi:hypothetical protein